MTFGVAVDHKYAYKFDMKKNFLYCYKSQTLQTYKTYNFQVVVLILPISL
jgi:hypothetical protein